MSKALGIQFSYTKRTKQEFERQLRLSQRNFQKLGIKTLEVMAALDDDFIADYGFKSIEA